MKICAVNGSPRKNGNTAEVLRHALEGAMSIPEISTKMIHLSGINFSACTSCFECKRTGSKSYGKCAINDGLTPVIEELSYVDGIIFGSPVYFGNITGKMKSFLERLLFPYCTYETGYKTIAPKKMNTAFIYTMNVDRQTMTDQNYPRQFKFMENFIGMVFRAPEVIHVNNTYQFDDYTLYNVECFSEIEKREHRKTQFPVDCQSAFELGKNMALSAFHAVSPRNADERRH